MSWDLYGDWQRRKSITINNVTGNQLTNHQILIELTTLNFDYSQCEIDGSDIRFSGTSDNALDYWIEEWNYNGDSKIWVEIDAVPTGNNLCGYIYYNNPSASSESDGDETFEFFDDFKGTSLDTDKWDIKKVGTGTVTVTNSIVTLLPSMSNYDTVLLNTKGTYGTNNIVMEGLVYYEQSFSDVARYHKFGMGNVANINQTSWRGTDGYYYNSDSDRDGSINELINATTNSIPIKATTDWCPFNTWFKLKFYYLSDGTIGKIENDNAAEEVIDTTWLAAPKKPGLSASYILNYGGALKADWIRVRKYSAPEPTFVLGDEELNIIDFIGAGSFSITVPFMESISFGGSGLIDVVGPIEAHAAGAGLFDISIILNAKNEVEYTSKGNVSIETHTECKTEIEYLSKGNVSADLHLEYNLSTQLIAAGMFPAPSIMAFSDINAFKVTNWNVNKNYDDCMWKLTAPVADLNLPELYKNFRVLAKDHLENEHCIFLGMVPDSEYKLNIAKKTSQITGWDYAFYLSRQKVPRSMWVPDEDINPATLVDSFLGSSNWPNITGIEPYKIITVANWNTEKKQFKWNAGTSKWKAIQDMIEYCKYVFLVKWRETAGGFWYPVAYFVPEAIATLDDYLDVPDMLVIFKDNAVLSEVTGFGDFIVTIVEPTASGWPTFMQNLSHTGYYPKDTTVIYISSNSFLHAVNSDGTEKWKFPMGLSISAPIIDGDGVIYHGSQDDHLYAVYSDGTEKWKHNAGDQVQSTPALDEGGNIWYSSDNHDLVKLSHDGAYICNGWLDNKAYRNSPTIGHNGHIYILDADGNLASFYPSDCSEYWSGWWGRSWGNCCPAIGDDGTIYIGTGQFLLAMNPNGTDKWWGGPTGGKCQYCSPSIAADGTIYIGNGHLNNSLFAFWPDGSLRWRYDAPNPGFDGCAAIAPDGTIYASSYDGNLYAIWPDGTLKWTYLTGNSIFGSPVIGSDGTIYVGSCDHFLHAVNPDGSEKWKYDTGGEIWGSPAIG